MKKTAILFDLDGTVLDSKIGVFRSIEYALKKLSLPIPNESDLIAFLGPPIQLGFSSVCGVPQESVDSAVAFYREYYNNGGKFEASLYDGIVDAICSFRNAGFACYITTSKPQKFAVEILKHFGIYTLFDAVYGCELDGTRSSKKDVLSYCLEQRSLSNDEVILVGDRIYDVNGAAALSIECVGVLYGYGSREELQEAGATFICETPQEVCRLISSM